jgi:hypothetical protein
LSIFPSLLKEGQVSQPFLVWDLGLPDWQAEINTTVMTNDESTLLMLIIVSLKKPRSDKERGLLVI